MATHWYLAQVVPACLSSLADKQIKAIEEAVLHYIQCRFLPLLASLLFFTST